MIDVDIDDTSNIRSSICGLKLMGKSSKGVYIGPKDGEEQCDVFVIIDDTHMTIHFYEYKRKLDLSRDSCGYILEKGHSILENIKDNVIFTYTRKIGSSGTSMLKISNLNVNIEMVDMRIWVTNCVGRWVPTRNGVRLHYVHMKNLLTLMKTF